jgi:hypothetical protein
LSEVIVTGSDERTNLLYYRSTKFYNESQNGPHYDTSHFTALSDSVT